MMRWCAVLDGVVEEIMQRRDESGALLLIPRRDWSFRR
jgi:hypothetical protein